MKTYYENDRSAPSGYRVVFSNKQNTRLVRVFSSPFLARKFVNKLRHSKKCTLLSYPISCM